MQLPEHSFKINPSWGKRLQQTLGEAEKGDGIMVSLSRASLLEKKRKQASKSLPIRAIMCLNSILAKRTHSSTIPPNQKDLLAEESLVHRNVGKSAVNSKLILMFNKLSTTTKA